jgi:hypothetical protein
MNFIEKILKESLARIAVSDLCEPIKEKLAEIGVSWEYKITEIDIEKMDKMAKEQIEKELNTSVRNLDDNGVQSPELIKFFREKIANETTKADN